MSTEDDDFLYDSHDDEDDDQFEREQKRKKLRQRNSPVYLKAMEILKTVDAICSTLSKSDREDYANSLRESAMIIPAKIAGAIGTQNWIISMQNAAIIRHHAEYLLVGNHGLKEFTKTDKNYIKVLRTEVEEFRELFKAWVKTFDELEREEDEYEDEWGLFIRK